MEHTCKIRRHLSAWYQYPTLDQVCILMSQLTFIGIVHVNCVINCNVNTSPDVHHQQVSVPDVPPALAPQSGLCYM